MGPKDANVMANGVDPETVSCKILIVFLVKLYKR